MDDDKLGFLADPAAPAEEPASRDQGPGETEAVAGGPERGADGRFVAKAQGDGEGAQAPQPSTVAPEPGQVPISALLDEREKRRAAETRARELEERQAQAWRANPAPPSDAERIEAALYAQNLRTSRRFAERAYSPEVVREVHDWAAAKCDVDPAFNARMKASEDPYEAAKQAFDQEKILAEVKPGDLAAFRAWQTAQAELQAQAPFPAATDTPAPRSLATAPGNGGAGKPHVVVGEGQAFLNAIPR